MLFLYVRYKTINFKNKHEKEKAEIKRTVFRVKWIKPLSTNCLSVGYDSLDALKLVNIEDLSNQNIPMSQMRLICNIAQALKDHNVTSMNFCYSMYHLYCNFCFDRFIYFCKKLYIIVTSIFVSYMRALW